MTSNKDERQQRFAAAESRPMILRRFHTTKTRHLKKILIAGLLWAALPGFVACPDEHEPILHRDQLSA